MSTFGNVGDKFTSDIEISGYMRKGDVCTIIKNSLDSDGDIKVLNNRNESDFYIKPHNLTLYNEKSNEWKFSVPVMEEIDFNLMLSDMTKKNPLLLVTANTQSIVVVHSSLIKKSDFLNIKLPKNRKLISNNTNAFMIDDNFSVWVDWAKKVKSAKWNKKSSKKITVNVNSPTI